MKLQAGILLALCCALVTNLAFFYKQRGARRASLVCPRRPLRSARELLRCRAFALGMGLACVAWLLHVSALALAPLSVVQVVLAAGIALIGVMAEPLFGLRVGRGEWIGLTLAATGLAAFALTAPATGGAHSSFAPAAMASFEAGLAVLVVLLLAASAGRRSRATRGMMLGAASGILFAVSDVAIKALTGIVGAHGVLGLLSPWTAAALLASVIAFLASARAFQEGAAVAVIAVTSAAANLAAIAGGVLVFGDPLPGSAFGRSAQALGVFAVLLAAALMPIFAARSARAAVAAAG